MMAMEEVANNVPATPLPQPPPRTNAGWFQRGDQRINRDGRPKKSWAAYEDRAPRAGRFMLLWLPTQDFCQRLTSTGAPGVVNLPPDCTAISSRVDSARDAIAFVIQSETFPRIAKGAPIPEFKQEPALPADHAPCDDRLMVLWVPARNLAYRLGHQVAFWVTNLPPCIQIVSIRLDAARDAVAFVIRSDTFSMVAKGTPIPEFKPHFYYLRHE
jgi:hypothetical protein